MTIDRVKGRLLKIDIDIISWKMALRKLLVMCEDRSSKIICICNVHMLILSENNLILRDTLLNSDMVLPDGAPIAWAMRRLGYYSQLRINGPDFMLHSLSIAEKHHKSVFFYGGTPDNLKKLLHIFSKNYPRLNIVGSISPPFRDLTQDEDESYIHLINESNADIIFVGLGCPKQEIWMHNHRNKINSIMIGVGAAFDFHSGSIKRAPLWIRKYGLEWLHRLSIDPGRLWRRYFFTNSQFLLKVAIPLLFFKIRNLFF